MVEDDDLPLPRPVEPAKSSALSHTAGFDGDGEFGSVLLLHQRNVIQISLTGI